MYRKSLVSCAIGEFTCQRIDAPARSRRFLVGGIWLAARLLDEFEQTSIDMYRIQGSGISLWEFLLTLVLFAMLGLMSAPLYYRTIDSLHVSAETNRLVAALNFARVQAVVRHRPVSVCSSTDGVSCRATPWERGYIVFVDAGTVGVVDSSDRVLRREDVPEPRVRITLAGRSYVRFDSIRGLVARAADDRATSSTLEWLSRLSPVSSAYASDSPAYLARVFTVCSARSGRAINISPQGRISTNDVACGHPR